MRNVRWPVLSTALAGIFLLAPLAALTQEPPVKQDPPKKSEDKGPQPPGPGGPPQFGPRGPGGMMMGGPMMGLRKILKQFDKDGDGRLNKEERAAAREFLKKDGGRRFGPGGPGMVFFGGGLAKNLMEALDTNKDGIISKDELLTGVKTFFQNCDKEKKGALTENQIVEGMSRLLPRPPGTFDGPPAGGGPPGGPPQDVLIGGQDGPPGGFRGQDGPPGGFRLMGPGSMFGRGIFQRADANKDDKVTLEELTSAAEKLFAEADADKDGKLDEKEVEAGIGMLMPGPGGFGRGPGGRGPGGPGGFGGNREPPRPGPHVNPDDVKKYPGASLYEPTVLRTVFLEFEDEDWEAEMADFYHTDVDIPATMIVDGKKYPGVGVHFRGMSSFGGVPAGYKRSVNVSLDFVDGKQRLYGYKTLNLLNGHDDPSLMSAVLYSHIARQYIPAAKANMVKVVINGEYWGVYTNLQQFNKEFVSENYKTTKAARWKVRGPSPDSGLSYLGDNIDNYKRRYEIKSADKEKDWKDLIVLCKTLTQTPPEKLEEALKPILDVDGLLWFLAPDCALINCDGYWIRASDYSIYRDEAGKFHILPHDINECFRPAQGPGMFAPGGPGGGPGGRRGGPDGQGRPPGGQAEQGRQPGGPGGGMRTNAVDLDPLVGLNEVRKPLRSKILAVPKFREQYLRNIRTLADEWLDWKKLGPIVAQYRGLIEKDVEAETRNLDPFASFRRLTADAPTATENSPQVRRGPGMHMSLRTFAEQRRQFLLNHPEVKKLSQ